MLVYKYLYLYLHFYFGSKDISNTKEWIKKRFVKILIPYYVYIAVSIIYYVIFKIEYLNLRNITVTVLCLQLFDSAKIPGLGHLWFVPLILICYLITPILQKLYNNIFDNKKLKLGILKLIVLLIILQLFVLLPFININLILNLVCYIFGYFISRLYNKLKIGDKELKYITIIFSIVAIIISVVYILVNYTDIFGNIKGIFIVNRILSYKNVLNGISIFMLLYLIFKNKTEIKNNITNKILMILDKYSFEIYITHLIYILGPSSILNTFNNIVAEIIVIAILIGGSAWMLKKVSYSITSFILKGENKV